MEDELDMSEGSVKPKAVSLGPLPYNQRHNPRKISSVLAVIWEACWGQGGPPLRAAVCLTTYSGEELKVWPMSVQLFGSYVRGHGGIGQLTPGY